MGIRFDQPWALVAFLIPLLWWCYHLAKRYQAAGGRLPLLRSRQQATAARPGKRKEEKPDLKAVLRASRPGTFGWVRLVVITLLILALAGTTVSYGARNQAVMFIADLSASTGTVRMHMEKFVRDAISTMPNGDVAGVLAIGEDAQLEAPVSPRPTFSRFTAVVRPDFTDLERGLRLGAALLPSGYRPRLVLISDGKENVGNAMAEVQRLRQRGYTVDVVNVAPEHGPEALIKSIEAPGAIHLGERLELLMTLTASQSTRAQLRIYQERTLLETRQLNLHAGDQEVRVTMEGLGPGYHRIWAVLEAERDTLTQNNESAVMVHVQGAPSILLVEAVPGASTNIQRALESTGMAVEVRTPDALPTHGPQFARWASVVLVDVPASLIRPGAMDALQKYVQQGGHGLVVVGGENSYSMGGYAGTKLEETLPITMDTPQRKEHPPIAVALVIENFESDAKVNVSKEAGKALVDLLTPQDYIMVSDVTVVGMWQVPPQKVTDKQKIKDLIDGMAPGDPPHYMNHLEDAARELEKLDAKVKHIVFAGDGDAQAISFEEYARRIAAINAKGITLSTVHVNWLFPGEEVLMQLMARVGGGRYYLAQDAGITPQIFLKEAQSIARPAIVEEDFYPGLLTNSPVMHGIDSVPLLRGYIGTTPKPTGEVVLQSHQADPILATWQSGLGRVAAFTSDSGGLWSEHMVGWDQFAQFWSNVVSWSMPAADESGLRTVATVVGGKAHLTVQIPGEGLAVGGVGGENSWPPNITAGIIRPDGSTQVMSLFATAPGQYDGEIPAAMPGPYHVKLNAGTKQQSVLLGETFIVVPFSPEFASTGTDPAFMERLARAGEGKVIDDPKTAFARDLPPAPGRLPLDQALLVAALLLWPVDIALRRLSLTVADVRDALRRRRERQAAVVGGGAASQALDRLKERRQAERGGPAPAPQPQRASPRTAPPAAAASPPAAPTQPSEQQTAATKEEGGSFAERLLARKRKQ